MTVHHKETGFRLRTIFIHIKADLLSKSFKRAALVSYVLIVTMKQ